MMRVSPKNVRLVLAVAFTLASLVLLGWSLWPYGRGVRSQTILPSEMQLSVPAGAGIAPGVPETRLLRLDFPQAIRAGDMDVVRLTLDVDAQGNLTPTVTAAGKVTQGADVHPNAYDNYNVLAEARLDMAGMVVLPAEAVSEPVLPGHGVIFLWSMRPTELGDHRGTVWLFLHFVPKSGGAQSRQPLSAQGIEIGANALFGLLTGPARWLGVVGTFISALLGLPYLAAALAGLRKKSETRNEK